MNIFSSLLNLLKSKIKKNIEQFTKSKKADQAEQTEQEAKQEVKQEVKEAKQEVKEELKQASKKISVNSKHIKTIIASTVGLVLILSGVAAVKFLFFNNVSENDIKKEENINIFELTNADKNLFKAVRDNNLNAIADSLNNGGRIDIADERGTTPLKVAISLNREDIVRNFIKIWRDDLNKNNKLNNKNNKIENSNLVYAVVQNKPQIVKELMQLPFNVNIPDKNGMTPLLYAIDRNYAKVTRELLNAGADVEAPGKDGISPLITAVSAGRRDIVSELLNAGANINAVSPSGDTPMSIAQQRNRVVIMSLLDEAEKKQRQNLYNLNMNNGANGANKIINGVMNGFISGEIVSKNSISNDSGFVDLKINYLELANIKAKDTEAFSNINNINTNKNNKK